MEGQRHGYDNLTIGITYTAPGGAVLDFFPFTTPEAKAMAEEARQAKAQVKTK